MRLLSKLANWIKVVLLPLGAWGLLPAAFLDSSFLPLPGGLDFLLMSLCARRPSWMIYYVALAAAGSVGGCALLYFAARGGRQILTDKKTPPARVNRWVKSYGGWTIMGASILPPPLPFKVFVIAAGLLRQPLPAFLLGLAVGRFLRYFILGWLAVHYGRVAWELVGHNAALALGITAALLIGGFFLTRVISNALSGD